MRHYKPDSEEPTPVFVLDSGETNAEGRLPYLDHGILDILANATNGIGIVLEHRYYGTSLPERAALGCGTKWGVDELRWLTTEQALEDNAQFVQKMRFDGVADDAMDRLRAPNTPVISYGGSYPGAKSAFVRVLYPDLFWGSLASSAVVAAIEEFPDYFYPIAHGAQQDCTQALQGAIAWIDEIIAPDPATGQHQPSRNTMEARKLMALFGVEQLSNIADFANLLTAPLGSFQALNWDPSVTSGAFEAFCTALVGHPSGPMTATPQLAARNHKSEAYPAVVRNFAEYIKSHYVEDCTSSNMTVDECFGTQDWTAYTNATTLDDVNGIAWSFQVCTQWGYFMTAPPVVPHEKRGPHDFRTSGPKLVSTLLDLEYTSEMCRKGFAGGKHFRVPAHPDVGAINKLGNFSLEMDRLAFIDGQFDPWRPATVHSTTHAYGGARLDTLDRPFKLISDCWHHCDENGNRTMEPPRIQAIHAQEIDFVQHWLRQWPKGKKAAAP